MKKIYGKVIAVQPHDRIVRILTKNQITALYMSRKLFKDFGPYFVSKPYIFVEVANDKKRSAQYMSYEVLSFIKIIQNSRGRKNVYYDISVIRRGVKKLLNKTKYKLFLDLEFSLPSYYQTMVHVPEIIQYGIVLEDGEGKVIFEEGALLKPLRGYSLNQRTLNFLSKKRIDFEDAMGYIEFYQLLEELINKYDAKVIAWGKSDILTLEQSFTINHLYPLDIRNRYINLMQVIKNYHNYKNDLGLFTTYETLSNEKLATQSHDALVDAQVARKIYNIFKDIVDKENR